MTRPIIKLSATQSAGKSQGIIRDWLKAYGCRSFGIGEQDEDGIIQFQLPVGEQTIPIQIVVRTKAYAAVMMKRDPYEYVSENGRTVRKRISRAQWASQHRADAEKAAWSLAAQKIQTDLSMVELGIQTLEEIFLPHIVTPKGITVSSGFSIQRLLEGKNPMLLTEGGA